MKSPEKGALERKEHVFSKIVGDDDAASVSSSSVVRKISVLYKMN